jgi:hypothetical protein
MLQTVKSWANPPRGPQFRVIFRVKHRPSGRAKEYPIIEHRRTYRVSVDGEMLTLATANRVIKKEIYDEHRPTTRLP